MDKVILNNETSLDIDSSGIVRTTNGLILTFTNQTVDNLESLMTKANLATIKFATSDGGVYATYNNLTCLSIAKLMTSGNIDVALYEENAIEERVSTLEGQNSEMLMALVRLGAI